MAVRIRYKVEIAISSTTAEERDLGNLKLEVMSDDHGEGGGWKTTLAAGAANIQLPLDSIATARFLAVRTNAKDPLNTPSEIRLRFNSVMGEERPVLPIGSATEGFLLMSTSGLTSLFASNPGTVDMELTLFVCGD